MLRGGNMDKKQVSKDLHSRAAAYILGETSTLRLRGDRATIRATKQVIEASRSLYDALTAYEPSPTQIAEALANKKHAAHKFTKITGVNWLL